jgi:hypothetical protein
MMIVNGKFGMVGKNLEGSGNGLFQDTFPAPAKSEENYDTLLLDNM